MHLQVKSLKELLKGLAAYVKQYHATGPAWQPSGIPISQFRPGAQASSGKSLSAQVLRGKRYTGVAIRATFKYLWLYQVH